MKHTDRFLAYVGLTCGVGALAMALHSRTPVSVVAAVAPPQPASAVEAATPTNGPVSWSLVAHRLRQDLRLEENQTTTLDRALEGCEEALETARKHPDALWRNRLEHRAHRDAYDKLMAVLKREQQEDFSVWLQAPSHTNMAAWFEHPKEGCCGGS